MDLTVWPGWKTLRTIGSGSYGTVYEIARDVFGETEKAALKVITIPKSGEDIEELRNEGYDDDSITERFQSYLKDIVHEYSLMAKMKGHANVVYCDDIKYVQHEDGIGWNIYIKMELLTPLMKTLQTVCTEKEIVKLGRDICSALVMCKRFNIVHRDIKPQNMFVSKDGNYKLGDFGIAKTAERTTSGTKTGTPKYMAPEVYNNQPYGSSTDIYSLGLVLYWLLNERRTPFLPMPPQKVTASMEEEARRRRFTGDALPPPKHGSSLLKRIVLKACAYAPSDRFSTAEEMLRALEGLMESDARIFPARAADQEASEGTISAIREAPEGEETASVLWNQSPSHSTGHIHKVPSDKKQPAAAAVKHGTPQAIEPAPKPSIPTMIPSKKPESKKPIGKPYMDPLSEEKSEDNNRTKPLLLYILLGAGVLVALLLLLVLPKHGDGQEQTKLSSELSTVDTLKSYTTEEETTETVTTTAETAAATEAALLQRDWTDWLDNLPEGITQQDYDIEEQILYSVRKLEQKTSTTEKEIEGWELYQTAKGDGSFGPWSDWSENAVSQTDDRQVEKQEQYRYRLKETTTSSNSSLSGWTKYDTSYTYGSYGAWSNWSTDAVSGSDERKVEAKTQFRYRDVTTTTSYGDWSGWGDWQDARESTGDTKREDTRSLWGYYYYRCPSCGAHMPDSGTCSTWAGGCGAGIPSGSFYSTWSTTAWSSAGLSSWYGTGNQYGYVNGELVFSWSSSGSPLTQYRYSTRTLNTSESYGSWSSWSDTKVSASSSRNVETRTMYRYCTRSQTPTYYFYRWGNWSGWSANAVSSNDNRQVETKTYYRSREKTYTTTYYFRRWTNWSEYSATPQEKSDAVEVRTKTQYRYRSKQAQ